MSRFNKTKRLRIKPLVASFLVSGLVGSLAHADGYQLADGLTLSGFLDMSYLASDPDEGDTVYDSGVDQFELNLMYDFGSGLSATVDLEYDDNGSGEEVNMEQAYLKYALSDAWSIKAGRFLSYSGWETEDPTGLFQYSGTGYGKYFYGAYQQGASVYFGSDSFDAAISIVNDIGTLDGESRDAENPAVEAMFALHPVEAWTLKAFYMTEESDINGQDVDMINVWTSYAVENWTFALEYNTSENTNAAVGIAGSEAEASGGLAMVSYALDKWAFTFRYHEWEVESDGGITVEDFSGYTFAPSYKIHPNMLLVFEYRHDEEDVSGADFDTFAIEALLTF